MSDKTKIEATPGGREVAITHEIAAPRERVYEAWTDPSLLAQWLGPRRLKMTVDEMNPVAGGKYRYIHSDDEGNEFGFHGVFHEAKPPERLVSTFEFEGAPGHVSLDTLELEEAGGKTKIKVISVHQTPEARDAMLAAGMETGVREGYERLEELLAS